MSYYFHFHFHKPHDGHRRAPRKANDYRYKEEGFALIATLSVLILLALIAIGLLSLSTVSLRTSSSEQAMNEARANARMALVLAIAQLQKTAGTDQRITAAADVLSENATITAGRSHWTGVWKSDVVAVGPATTPSYSQASPEVREFADWLVSYPPVAAPDPNLVTSATGADDVLIFEGPTAESSVKVPKLTIFDGSGNQGSLAYWVEDEGLKADLSWREGSFTQAEQAQAARLSAAPGPDFEVFQGPFSNLTYPISNDVAWISDKLPKALGPADMPLVMDDTASYNDWLKGNRHHFTVGSLGVMSDVKLGGLRRDLSLAFEMDGNTNEVDWDAVSALHIFSNGVPKFNAQFGEFSSEAIETDIFAARQSMHGTTARYVYAANSTAGSLFSSDISASTEAIRGPTWHALRYYANSYKRLTGTSGNYSYSAAPTYPNGNSVSVSNGETGPYAVIEMNGSLQESAMYDGYDPTGGAKVTRYMEKPFQPNYVPVNLGYVILLSIYSQPTDDGKGEKLTLGVDPIFFMWNPYNRNLTAERVLLSYRTALPGYLQVWIDGTPKMQLPEDFELGEIMGRSAGIGNPAATTHSSYSLSNLEFAPGEVKVFSPPVDPSMVSAGSNHPFNTDALPGVDLSITSGGVITSFPSNWTEINTDDFQNVSVAWGMAAGLVDNYFRTSFPTLSSTNNQAGRLKRFGPVASATFPRFFYPGLSASYDFFEPDMELGDFAESDAAGPFTSASLSGTKQFIGIFSTLNSPANYTGQNPTPVEIFARFNPLAQAIYGSEALGRNGSWYQEVNVICRDFGSDFVGALKEVGIVLPVGNDPNTPTDKGYWGSSYEGDGTGSLASTSVPIIDIPSSPLLSITQFAHANLSVLADDPLKAVGSSLASPFISPESPFGTRAQADDSSITPTISDTAWLLNDVLFDRYYLSGIAPAYTLNGTYQQTISDTEEAIEDTLTNLFSNNPSQANANPVLQPYLPQDSISQDAITALKADDGYRKLGAYSLIQGAFNINSTSVPAWEALLRSNKKLSITSSEGVIDAVSDGTPFPNGTLPSNSPDAADGWAGFSSLSDSQINTLATEIVNQVKLRGPIMSLSDFVNHRVGTPIRQDTHYKGTLQSAIDDSGINADVVTKAGGTTVNYSTSNLKNSFTNPSDELRPTTTGIGTSITQINLLAALAPKLSARSDTFRIRAYGESLASDGVTVLATAICEAVVQRLPQYVDTSDEPWLEANYDPSSTSPGSPLIPKASSNLSETNQIYGRRFETLSFRWLSPNEN